MARPTLAILLGLGLSALVVAGFIVPLDSFTPVRHVCPDGPPPVKRVAVISEGSLARYREADNEPVNPVVGCSRQFRYVLYTL